MSVSFLEGIVTHKYPNGNFNVWNYTVSTGATYFSHNDTANINVGDVIKCQFNNQQFGRVVAFEKI